MNFPFTNQLGGKRLRTILPENGSRIFWQQYELDFLREKCHVTKVEVSLPGIDRNVAVPNSDAVDNK
jgi:hypothetical protein